MATSSSFVAACTAAINADAACIAALGISVGTQKVFGIQAIRATASPNTVPPGYPGPVQPPYVRLLEVSADDTFQSGPGSSAINYFERGILQVDVFDISEASARANGKLVAHVLNDATLDFADGSNLELRQSRQFFVPEPDAGPTGLGIMYHRIIEFTYMNEYQL